MVRGAYSRGAGAARYSSNAAIRGTGLRSWARARVYGMKNANASRFASNRGGAAASRNLAISRGRYTGYGSYRRAPSSYTRGRGGQGAARGAAAVSSAYRGGNSSTRNGVQAWRERQAQRGARGGAFPARRGGFRGGRGGGGFRGGRGGARGGRGGRGGGVSVNKESLDAELDKYMGDDNIKKRLDNDLENYFSRSGGAVAGSPAAGAGAPSQTDDAARVAGTAVVANGTAADATVSGGVAPRGGMDVSMDNSL